VKIAVIGCGLIGKRRGEQLEGHELVGVFDIDSGRSTALAKELHTKAFLSLDDLLKKSGAEIAIVAVVNSELTPVTLMCLAAGIHVLVEKPGAISLEQIGQLELAQAKYQRLVKVGFNHRFHPALLKAHSMFKEGLLGEPMYMRAKYGHGGRVGYDKEWRAIPSVGGGGELIDQGVHILDLVYWFLGPLPLASSFVTTSFWDMTVDDNAVLTLSDKKVWASFVVSCSEWKNNFQLELYGRKGKISIDGLGRSYGKESLTYYKMKPST
jgi:predicted dehydrogenase